MTTSTHATNIFANCTSIYGYYSYKERENESATRAKNKINIANFLSLFPIIRIGVGVWRIYTNIFLVMDPQASDAQKTIGYSGIARGAAEVLLPDSFVVLLLAADIGMTVLRYFPFSLATT